MQKNTQKYRWRKICTKILVHPKILAPSKSLADVKTGSAMLKMVKSLMQAKSLAST
jgi:hypothetical protein